MTNLKARRHSRTQLPATPSTTPQPVSVVRTTGWGLPRRGRLALGPLSPARGLARRGAGRLPARGPGQRPGQGAKPVLRVMSGAGLGVALPAGHSGRAHGHTHFRAHGTPCANQKSWPCRPGQDSPDDAAPKAQGAVTPAGSGGSAQATLGCPWGGRGPPSSGHADWRALVWRSLAADTQTRRQGLWRSRSRMRQGRPRGRSHGPLGSRVRPC